MRPLTGGPRTLAALAAAFGLVCQDDRGIMGQSPVMPRKRLDKPGQKWPCRGAFRFSVSSGRPVRGQERW